MPGRFGEKLRYLREQASLSQSDLARQLEDVTQSHLSYLESGQKAPSLEMVARLAAFFGVSADSLLRDSQSLPSTRATMPSASIERQLSHLGPHIRRIRQARGLSQQELAQSLQYASRPFVSLIETGRKTPSPDVVLQIADALRVSLDDLLAGPSEAE